MMAQWGADWTVSTMRELIESHGAIPEDRWVYVPSEGDWHLDMPALTAVSVEVPPEMEDEPLAGYHPEALKRGMKMFLVAPSFSDAIENAKMQSSTLSIEDLYAAVMHYWEFDSFKSFEA